MPELSGIARPYSKAVFEFAQAADENLAEWSHALDLLAAIAADPQLTAFINNPRTTAEQQEEVVLQTAAKANKRKVSELYPPFVNLVKLLVRNNRLQAAPQIAQIFATRRAEAENVLEAKMTTATEIDAHQRKQFTEALRVKLGRDIQLEFAVDHALIGGAVIRAGDWVIDGSVQAQLEQLGGALRA